MRWFEDLFGFAELDRESVYKELAVDGNKLRSTIRGTEWTCGELEIASLAELLDHANQLVSTPSARIKVSEVIGDAKSLHADPANAGAMFQVASQFNLLEMVSPSVTPEQGITRYAQDATQGPACAVACGAGTVYRNYFVELDGQLGQTAEKQIDCLAAIGDALGNAQEALWSMKNGYALPTDQGLREIDLKLSVMSEDALAGLRGMLKIGVQWDTQVTLTGCTHLVSQAYCSAMPVAYSGLPSNEWERFARLILEAAYEATFAAAVINASRTGNWCLFLTMLGGGVFGNEPSWIMNAIGRAVELYARFPLDVRIVSYGRSHSSVRALCEQVAR